MSTILKSIRAILSTTPQHWNALITLMPEEQLNQQPAEGEWSAVECLRHMIMTEQIGFPVRLQALSQNQDILDLDPAQVPAEIATATAAELVAIFSQLRTASLELFDQVQEADFDHSGVHSELGRVTLGNLMHEWAAHDLDHTIQAERTLMQPFIRGSGPWQIYFAANRIGE